MLHAASAPPYAGRHPPTAWTLPSALLRLLAPMNHRRAHGAVWQPRPAVSHPSWTSCVTVIAPLPPSSGIAPTKHGKTRQDTVGRLPSPYACTVAIHRALVAAVRAHWSLTVMNCGRSSSSQAIVATREKVGREAASSLIQPTLVSSPLHVTAAGRHSYPLPPGARSPIFPPSPL